MKLAPKNSWRARLLRVVARGRAWVRRRLPSGWRWPVGLVVLSLGFLGFLPVIGFWMIPLGVAIIAMDVRPAWRRWKRWRGFQDG